MTGLDEARPTRRNNERTVAGCHRMMRRADREVTDCEQIEGIIGRMPYRACGLCGCRGTDDRAAEFRIRMAAARGSRHRRRTGRIDPVHPLGVDRPQTRRDPGCGKRVGCGVLDGD